MRIQAAGERGGVYTVSGIFDYNSNTLNESPVFVSLRGAQTLFDPLANMKVGAQILKEYLGRDGTVESHRVRRRMRVSMALAPSSVFSALIACSG